MSVAADCFADLLITDRASIREAMAALNHNGREVVLVRDDAGRVAGLITDGDIRRGLLSGFTLEASATDVMRRDFFAAAPGTDRASILDLMRARLFQHMPVLDSDGRLVAIHFLRDLIGAAPKPNCAVIMAGGKGTRLRPLTETIPKPMVEVAGRPILERVVLHLISHGIHDIFLSVNYKAEAIEDHFADGAAYGCRIEYLRETEAVGTGGALALLPERPSDSLLVLNGDQITRANLTAMLESHIANQNCATIGVGPYHVQVPFGAVTERDGRLILLEEKPTIELTVNRGIYVLEPRTLDFVAKRREFPITALFEALLEAQQRVGVYHFDDYWMDIGRPADLQRANGLLIAEAGA